MIMEGKDESEDNQRDRSPFTKTQGCCHNAIGVRLKKVILVATYNFFRDLTYLVRLQGLLPYDIILENVFIL